MNKEYNGLSLRATGKMWMCGCASVRVSVRVRVRASVRFIVRFRHFQIQKIRRSARPHFTRGHHCISECVGRSFLLAAADGRQT